MGHQAQKECQYDERRKNHQEPSGFGEAGWETRQRQSGLQGDGLIDQSVS